MKMACSNELYAKFTLAIIGLVLVLSICSASDESNDNQIETEYVGRGRPSSRYLVTECKSCSSSECTVMGMQRYAEPRCEAFGGIGAPCRPYQEPDNKTLHFPNTIMYCTNVYMQFCPCAPGLVCDLDLAECKRPEVEQESSQQGSPLASLESAGFQDDYEPIPVAFEPMQQQQFQQQRRPANSGEFPWGVARFH